MAMKIKQLINSTLLIVSVWTLPHFSVAGNIDDYTRGLWGDCGNSGKNEFRNGSVFQRNLNHVLDSLVGNVSLSGFSKSSVDEGQNSNSTVYGLVQCRGDLGSSDCKRCAATAKAKLLQDCYNTSGFIQLNGCFMRYDSSNFDNDDSYGYLNVYICNHGTANLAVQFTNDAKGRFANTSNKAAESPKRFAADMFQDDLSPSYYIYIIAQCIRDMARDSCNACLAEGLNGIFVTWCHKTGAIGASFFASGCQLRFETYPFFNVSILSPPPPPPPPPGKNGSILSPVSSPPPGSSEGKRSNVLRITLGVVATVGGLIAIIGLWKWNFDSRQKRWELVDRPTGPENGEEGEISLCPTIANLELIFKYDILREATSNFNEENKLGHGGFGSVFKGNLRDGRVIAVKRLYRGSSQGDAEFLNEANLISCIQHRNLVKLLGCSFENSERLLVYEYLQNSSLDKILFDRTRRHLLNWQQRYEIIVGTARGLVYLHEESEIRIIHRDIKASNILLDNKLKPKIADFGLAKLFAEDHSHVSTGIAGTIGYMAPEYALRGQLTEKADVFSFGVLVLEIISGRKNQSSAQGMEFLIEGAWRLYKAEKALEIMDPILEGSYPWEEGIRVIKVGLLCTQAAAASRPSMSRVVSMLTSEREYLPSPTRPPFMDLDNVGTPDQVKPPRVIDPDKTSSSNRSSKAASSSRTPSEIYSAAADPSSGNLEPR